MLGTDGARADVSSLGFWNPLSQAFFDVRVNPLAETTLKPLIFATLIFATLIFANEGKNLKVFCDINFCDCLFLKDFATLIFANYQERKYSTNCFSAFI